MFGGMGKGDKGGEGIMTDFFLVLWWLGVAGGVFLFFVACGSLVRVGLRWFWGKQKSEKKKGREERCQMNQQNS